MNYHLLEPKWDSVALHLKNTQAASTAVCQYAEGSYRNRVGSATGFSVMNNLRWVISDSINEYLISLKENHPWLKNYRG